MHHVTPAHTPPVPPPLPAPAPHAVQMTPTHAATPGTELVPKGSHAIAGGDAKSKGKKRRYLLIVALALAVAVMVRLSSKLTAAMRAKKDKQPKTEANSNDEKRNDGKSTAQPSAGPQTSAASRTSAARPPPVPKPVPSAENAHDSQKLSATESVRQDVEASRPTPPPVNSAPARKKEHETVSADEYFMPI